MTSSVTQGKPPSLAPEQAKMIAEYPADYIAMLERAYGEGFLAEGGEDSVLKLFTGIDTHGKKALEIGCGVGGGAKVAAEQLGMTVTGLEVNPAMVAEATSRIPDHLKENLAYCGYERWGQLPFADRSFHLVFSKGVFCQIDQKSPLLAETHRVLTPQGLLVLGDWLSRTHGQWPPEIQEIAEDEDLSLFAVDEHHYRQQLQAHGFTIILAENVSKVYAEYNTAVVSHLEKPPVKAGFIRDFGQTNYDLSIDGYRKLAASMTAGSLLCYRLVAQKNATSPDPGE